MNLHVHRGLFRRSSRGLRWWVSDSCPLPAQLTPKQTLLTSTALAGLGRGIMVVPAEVTLSWEGKQSPGLGMEGAVSG